MNISQTPKNESLIPNLLLLGKKLDFIWIRDKVGINHVHENLMIQPHSFIILFFRVPSNLSTQTQGYDTNYIHIQCAKRQILCQIT